jgi:HK97 family phage prohead protease
VTTVREVELKELLTDQPGTGQFIGLAATWDLDLVGDRIIKGAFTKSLAEWKRTGDSIPVLWSHNMGQLSSYVGKLLDARETDRGLEVTGQLFLDDPEGAKMHRLLKERVVSKMSFAYDILDSRRASDGVRELLDLRLIETSLVLMPANPRATVLAVKQGRRNNAADVQRLERLGELLAEAQSLIAELTATPTDPDAEPKAGRKLLDIQREVRELMSESGNGRVEELRRELAAIR